MQESSWLADGVKEIERVTQASMIVEPKVITLPGEKSGTYAIYTPAPAGTKIDITKHLAGPKWHNERLETPDQLILFVNGLRERKQKIDDAAVYVGRDCIRFVYSFEDRRDRATVPLTLSTPWKTLQQLGQPIDQRALLRLLRITFAGCLPDGSPLVDVIRNVKWTSNGSVEANLQKGKEALGRQILNEAAGINNFPDDFLLSVRPFENFPHTVLVRVALELLPEQTKFEVVPLPNQLYDGMEATLLRLQEHIADGAKLPTFIGEVSAGNKSDE